MEIQGYIFPDELYYHKDHTWVRLDGDGGVTIGMTDFYSRMAGDTTHIDLPDEGDEIEQNGTIGKVQSGKWIGKLYAPVSGEILTINPLLEDNFLIVNKESYGQGWIARIKPVNLEEDLSRLMHGRESMNEFISKEIVRIMPGGAHGA